jgi:hypothetical protein
MSKDATKARARRYAQRIRSNRNTRGPYSVFGRIKEAHIDGCADSLGALYPSDEPSEDEFVQVLLRHESRNPQCFSTKGQIEIELRKARVEEQNHRTVVRDVNRAVITKLDPAEKLEFANTGSLPNRFVIKGPDES